MRIAIELLKLDGSSARSSFTLVDGDGRRYPVGPETWRQRRSPSADVALVEQGTAADPGFCWKDP